MFDSLLPSLHLQRFSIPENAAYGSRLSAATAHNLYQNALQTAHDRVLKVWESATTARRDQVMQELNAWLGTLPADWSKTLLNCSPTDLLAFIETHWLPLHGVLSCQMTPKLPPLVVSIFASPVSPLASPFWAELGPGVLLLPTATQFIQLTLSTTARAIVCSLGAVAIKRPQLYP